MRGYIYGTLVLGLLVLSCKVDHSIKSNTFTLLDNAKLGIAFENNVPYTEEFNTYTYRNFYNGGGVAIGDINNDGLSDIYFTGNIDDNKLYLNKGNWQFDDITSSAGVECPNVWSTGVTLVDINGDGWLDIYVCKAGKPGGSNRHNELFINNQDLTFTEMSQQYGLDITGLSIHAAFFDYDKDGDLDCYILNNSLRSVGGFDFIKDQRNIPDPEGNKFLINEDGHFVDRTTEVGIYSSKIGYGLGITLADINLDGWTDIFISNDFFERDYLYINNQKGGFKETGESAFETLSMGSMGADASDMDNDLLPDLFVTEMLPATHERRKTKAQYENWDKYQSGVKNGYGHQYSRNVLQRNMGQGTFAEIGRISGVAATEWSWSALMQDFDNDGIKDIFVSNGIYKDLLDRDYLNYFSNDTRISQRIKNKEKVLSFLIDSMPSKPLTNAMFKHGGNFDFVNVASEWGLDAETYSNGSAYGDLDNDGDLDLVINNVNSACMVYRNDIDTATNRSIRLKLLGKGNNSNAIGAKIYVLHNGSQKMIEHYTAKGFQSTVENISHIGVGNVSIVDTVVIAWPDLTWSILYDVPTNKLKIVDQTKTMTLTTAPLQLYHAHELPKGMELAEIDFTHEDINTNLFVRERLLSDMVGFEGPKLLSADFNRDGKDDLFCGGGMGQVSTLYLSTEQGYQGLSKPFIDQSKGSVTDAIAIDVDNDGDLDLYVARGAYPISPFSEDNNDLLYLNDGAGNMSKKSDFIKFDKSIYTSCVAASDIDNDGLVDVVIGERHTSKAQGLDCGVYVLKNIGNGTFQKLDIPDLERLGLITDIEISDINKDGQQELVVCGKWMPLTIVSFTFNEQNKVNISEMPNSKGLWNTILLVDIDNDGLQEILAGNEGANNFYSTGMRWYIKDFDNNGYIEQLMCEKVGEKYYPIHDLDEIYSQLPMLKKRFTKYDPFSKAAMSDIFTERELEGALVKELDILESCIFSHNTSGSYDMRPLPKEFQYSCIHTFFSEPSSQGMQLIAGGNMYKIKPQFGRQDASQGWKVLIDQNKNFGPVSPLYIRGQIRDMALFNKKLLFGINNEAIKSINIDEI